MPNPYSLKCTSLRACTNKHPHPIVQKKNPHPEQLTLELPETDLYGGLELQAALIGRYAFVLVKVDVILVK
jgi:hypothetical protein